MEKSALRKLYLQKRNELSANEIDRLTGAISEHFFNLDFSGVKYLHLFYPIPEKLEFDTLILADWIRKNHPEIKLVLSKSDFETQRLTHYIWDADTLLSKNKWGITEPYSGAIVPPQLLDMILVPLLVFDSNGNRVGYGKGFYDRFLAECRSDAQKVGISFFEPVVEIEDVNNFDIRLDLSLSAKKTWRF